VAVIAEPEPGPAIKNINFLFECFTIYVKEPEWHHFAFPEPEPELQHCLVDQKEEAFCFKRLTNHAKLFWRVKSNSAKEKRRIVLEKRDKFSETRRHQRRIIVL
jgi:hypothetical protein